MAASQAEKLAGLLKHDWHRLAIDATYELADAESRETNLLQPLMELQAELGSPSHPDIDFAIASMAHPHELWEAMEHQLSRVSSALKRAWGNRKPPYAKDVDIVRDIFGNPFRPVAFSPAWRTSAAIGIASTMYDSRNFNAMPILADAIQDAGCEDDTILSHCRDEKQIHVRGCWVVDLVLGKK